jgi:hypothetical protein
MTQCPCEPFVSQLPNISNGELGPVPRGSWGWRAWRLQSTPNPQQRHPFVPCVPHPNSGNGSVLAGHDAACCQVRATSTVATDSQANGGPHR